MITGELRNKFRFCGGIIMAKKLSRIIATIMLVLAVVFWWYALNHPEGSFPWSNTVTFSLYGVYIVAMIILYIAPFKKK